MKSYRYTVDMSIKFKILINLHASAINHRLKFELTDNSQPFDDLLIFRIKHRRIFINFSIRDEYVKRYIFKRPIDRN